MNETELFQDLALPNGPPSFRPDQGGQTNKGGPFDDAKNLRSSFAFLEPPVLKKLKMESLGRERDDDDDVVESSSDEEIYDYPDEGEFNQANRVEEEEESGEEEETEEETEEEGEEEGEEDEEEVDRRTEERLKIRKFEDLKKLKDVKEEDLERVAEEFPRKLKNLVFRCCGKFIDNKDERKEFLEKMEVKVKENEEHYNKTSNSCVRGIKKLIKAGTEGMRAMQFAIQTVKDVIERVKKLRKFTIEVNHMDIRIGKLERDFMKVETVYFEDDFEEQLETLFERMRVLKEDFDHLLKRIRNFKLSVKVRRRLAIAFAIGALGAGIVLFGGGLLTAFVGVGAFITTLLTKGLAAPVVAVLLILSVVGVFSGLAVCVITAFSSVLIFVSAFLQNWSCARSLKKSVKLVKRIKAHKSKFWWKKMELLMRKVSEKEQSKAAILKDVEEIVKGYQERQLRPDEFREEEEEEEEDTSEEERRRKKRKKKKKKKKKRRVRRVVVEPDTDSDEESESEGEDTDSD